VTSDWTSLDKAPVLLNVVGQLEGVVRRRPNCLVASVTRPVAFAGRKTTDRSVKEQERNRSGECSADYLNCGQQTSTDLDCAGDSLFSQVSELWKRPWGSRSIRAGRLGVSRPRPDPDRTTLVSHPFDQQTHQLRKHDVDQSRLMHN
jgi:hypothetical protein